MIIVEGIDNSGKSTLILRLQEEFRIPAIRSGMRPKSQSQITQYHNWCSISPSTLILDRHPAISDQVYGQILRGHSPASLALAQMLREDHYLIFCNPSLKKVTETLHEREQMSGVADAITPLYQEYRTLMEKLEPDFIYDYTQPNSTTALITHLTHYLARN